MAKKLKPVPKDVCRTVDSSEWFESVPYISGVFKDSIPEPNLDYFYAAFKLCSEWPLINYKGVSYLPEDLTKEVAESAVHAQVNLRHKKLSQVVGTVIACEKADDGLEVLIRFDRDQAGFHGLDPEDMKPGNIFSSVSLELSKDIQDSQFYIIDDKYNILKKLPYVKGIQQGIRRTDNSSKDLYYYQDKYRVVEMIKPLRITGVGLVPNPADPQAQVYAVAADTTSEERLKEGMAKLNYPQYKPPTAEETLENHKKMLEQEASYSLPQQYDMENDVPDYIDIHQSDADAMHEMACSYMSVNKEPYGKGAKYADPGFEKDHIKRYPLDTPAHVRAAASYFGMPKNRGKYSPEHQSHIMKAISAAKRRFNIGDESKEQASLDATQELQMSESEAKALTERFSALEASLAEIKSEKEKFSVEITTANEKITKLETELASVTSERDTFKAQAETLKSEKEAFAKESAISSLVADLEAIKPSSDDAAKAALREQASTAVGNDLLIRALKAERQVEALKEVASKKDPESEEDEAIAKLKKAQDEEKKRKEEASRKESFSTSHERPVIAPIYDASITDPKAKKEAISKALLFG